MTEICFGAKNYKKVFSWKKQKIIFVFAKNIYEKEGLIWMEGGNGPWESKGEKGKA